MKVRTRFAPSPTGFLHVGAIRTALFCVALSRKNHGEFIVRIEDTDEKRKIEGAVDTIFKELEWIGLAPDESVIHGGEYGPYIQSERKEIYREYANRLLNSGHAYYCFLEGDELAKFQEQYKGKGFRSPYRDQDEKTSLKMIEDGKPYVIRLKVPNDEIIDYEDGIQGKTKFDTNNVGDEILIKSTGMASYHLAVVVDDHLMKISHVFRAIEWLPSTPKQILIHRFLDMKMPPYFHLPVILDPDGGKLSKRKGAVSVGDFEKQGYLPEAILNFLMLLGWSSPEARVHGQKEREIYSLQEFIDLFDLKDLNKSNGVFNRDKLIWFNKEYLKNIDSSSFHNAYTKWLEKFAENSELKEKIMSDSTLDAKLSLVKDRVRLLSEVTDAIKFFYVAPKNVDWEIPQLTNIKDNLGAIRKEIYELINSFSEDSSRWTHEEWENGMRAIGDKYSAKHGDIFMVNRVAVVGAPFSPPLFEAMQLLGKEEVVKRFNS